MLSLYLLSGIATDFTFNIFGVKAYLSLFAGVVAFAVFLFLVTVMGNPIGPLRTKIGKLWLFFVVWMIIDVPFSRWRGGSFSMLTNYIPKIFLIFFFIGAFAATVKQCRTLMYAVIAGAFAAVLLAAVYGANVEGRYRIPASIQFAGPNDLALHLLVSIGLFLFLLTGDDVFHWIAGLAGVSSAFYFLVKTGSRGSMLACGAIFIAVFLLSGQRLKLFGVGFILALLLLIAPWSSLQRLSWITLDSADLADAESVSELRSLESQVQRQELIRQSLKYTIRYPLFGLGPGQFSEAYWSDYKRIGIHVPDLNTHNTYTQISSECGLPALFCYMGVLLLSIRTNYRLYQQTRGRPESRTVAGLAFCLFATLVGFGVNALFHHVGYTNYLPLLAGLTVALQAAAGRELAPAHPGTQSA